MPFTLQDVNTIEGEEDTSPFGLAASIQRAINAGMWSLQGSYGRTMMRAIEDGRCLLGRSDFRDYFRNHIPSRDQVEDGTKGSYGHVVAVKGQEWADKMREID